MESSVAFEVSLTQDVDLFNFIHIFNLWNQFSGSVSEGKDKPETRVQYQYEQLLKWNSPHAFPVYLQW